MQFSSNSFVNFENTPASGTQPDAGGGPLEAACPSRGPGDQPPGPLRGRPTEVFLPI